MMIAPFTHDGLYRNTDFRSGPGAEMEKPRTLALSALSRKSRASIGLCA
ncbi:MAG: hypothetical protein AAGE05_08890 [Pseudomonadota bacterium]